MKAVLMLGINLSRVYAILHNLAPGELEVTIEPVQINHPLDCPICDQGGECDLQDQVQTSFHHSVSISPLSKLSLTLLAGFASSVDVGGPLQGNSD